MTGFEADIRAQGELIRDLLSLDSDTSTLRAAASLASAGRPIVFAGMGSSLAAARPAADRLIASGRWAMAVEAGELLHYGDDALTRGSLVILVSQSGRSAETLALGERLHSAGESRLVAVVNDPASPLAGVANVVVPIHAGTEVTVSTKTFMASVVSLYTLADELIGSPGLTVDLALQCDLASRLAQVAAEPVIAAAAATAFSTVAALVVVGRGPAFAAAEYGALILKEACAIEAEAIPGGSFRHGPIEVAGPATGIVVLAPAGRTQALSVRLAADTARLGSPTWLLTGDGYETNGSGDVSTARDLLLSELPAVPEMLAPLLYSVPLQHLALKLAELRGREPGVVERSTKVTVSE